MTPAELSQCDATEQARLVRAGECSPVELTQAAIAAAEQVNGALNAIIHPLYEQALEAARGDLPDGPLRGVPIVIKDLDGTLAGAPYHAGSNQLRRSGYVATETSLAIGRLTAAGAVVIGKTNTPELGLVPSTEPVSAGPTHNPWDVTRSPAGSSGGSAAAVAAGIVAIGHAGDGGGSIRLPAANCGLVGLKPGRGVVPWWPDVQPWGGLVSRLAVTRSVRDTALALGVMGGPDPLESPPGGPVQEWSAVSQSDPGPLRVGVMTGSPDGTPVDPAVIAVVEATGAMLTEIGHHVDLACPPELSDPAFSQALTSEFLTVYPAWVAADVDDLVARSGRPADPDGFEAHTVALAEAGRQVTGPAMWTAYRALVGAGRSLRRWWRPVGERSEQTGFDVLLCPTCPELPWTLGQFGPTDDNPLAAVFRSSPLVSTCMPFNISGQPAMSVPVGMHAGLPVGVQMVSAMGGEGLLLAVAAQLEAMVGWQRRLPAVHASVSS